jgi:hypothetical protein
MYWKIELRARSHFGEHAVAQPLLLKRGEEAFFRGVVVRLPLRLLDCVNLWSRQTEQAKPAQR